MCDFVHLYGRPADRAPVQKQQEAAKAARHAKRPEKQRKERRSTFLHRFVKLPREIRDLVYDHTWTGMVLLFYQQVSLTYQRGYDPYDLLLAGEYCFSGNYTPRVTYTLHIPALRDCFPFIPVPKHEWIYTCRQIFVESTEQFYRHTQISNTGISIANMYARFPGIIQKRKLDDAVYAFPNIFFTRRVSVKVEEHGAVDWKGRRDDVQLDLLLALLSKTKSVREKKVLRIKMGTALTSLAFGDFSMEMMFEEGVGFQELKRKGWDITMRRWGALGVVG